MTIQFYINRGEPNRVYKDNYITAVGSEMNIVFKASTDLKNPELLLTIPNFVEESTYVNYAKINYGDRDIYYFIDNMIAYSKDNYTVRLREDVLFTFSPQITAGAFDFLITMGTRKDNVEDLTRPIFSGDVKLPVETEVILQEIDSPFTWNGQTYLLSIAG